MSTEDNHALMNGHSNQLFNNKQRFVVKCQSPFGIQQVASILLAFLIKQMNCTERSQQQLIQAYKKFNSFQLVEEASKKSKYHLQNFSKQPKRNCSEPRRVHFMFEQTGCDRKIEDATYREDITFSNGKTVVSQTLTEEQVQQLRTWNFNILTIPTLEEKFKYTLGMFIDTNLFEVLGCSVEKFYGFLTKLSDMYDHRHNPFHNFNHGITVAHGIYYIIQHGVISKHLTKTETFALLFSALCHDVDHTGHSNSYETNSKSQLFELYGNESPLEKHHFAETVKLAEEFSLFENVPEEDLVTIKKFLRSNILATDMSKHNQIMNEFKDNLPCLLSSDHVITEQQKLNLCGALVHAADIGAPTRDFDISKEWSLRIAKEFLAQVELEKSNNLPVTPFYKDLDKFLTLATNEIGFISFFIKPFWVEIQNFGQGKLEQVTTNIDNNIQSWKDEKVKEESRIAEVKS